MKIVFSPKDNPHKRYEYNGAVKLYEKDFCYIVEDIHGRNVSNHQYFQNKYDVVIGNCYCRNPDEIEEIEVSDND